MAKKKWTSEAGYAEALKRIEACRKSGEKSLTLTDLHLSTLPPEIGQLTALTDLYLYNSPLSTLPPEIGQLTALTDLYLDDNQLRTLPPEIGQLTALKRLFVQGNPLPQELLKLTGGPKGVGSKLIRLLRARSGGVALTRP